MKTTSLEFKIEDYIDQLLTVLDNDIAYIEENISTLNELRRLVIKQDIDALNCLLNNISTRARVHEHNESKRRMIRKELARLCNCQPEDITLTWFQTHRSGIKTSDIADKKRKLQSLTGLLKKEYAGTQILLADCARFNRRLLKSIFEIGQTENITYKQTGTPERQTDTVFMNVRF